MFGTRHVAPTAAKKTLLCRSLAKDKLTLMSTTWKTVRVFISSTFRDMHAERDHLVKVVFPALRSRLESYRVYLDDIDLRWGVTREQAENDMVLDICLQQIDACRPFFIGVLGERYGWVPTEFPVAALARYGWIQHYTGKSVTELEILHGVLENPDMSGCAFFYFRDPTALETLPPTLRSDYKETDPSRARKLADLKESIRRSGLPLLENYQARWDAGAIDPLMRTHGRLVNLEPFGQRVFEDLWHAIQAELRLGDVPSALEAPWLEEEDLHRRFMESRLRVYVERSTLHQKLLDYVLMPATAPTDNDSAGSEGAHRVCLVSGPSGTGKSATLAWLVTDLAARHPEVVVLPFFIGASPQSSNLRAMLQYLCTVLQARWRIIDELPQEVQPLSTCLRELLDRVPPGQRLVLVIDALNQLDPIHQAQELAWLPVELPPRVRMVVSCLRDDSSSQRALEVLETREHYPVPVPPLAEVERRAIISEVPSLAAKAFDEQQVRLLLANSNTANPLFLLVALEELRGYGSYEKLNERIQAFPDPQATSEQLGRAGFSYDSMTRAGDPVTAIFIQVIERLEQDFDRELVDQILALLASARRGLAERELRDLFAGHPRTNDLFPVLRQLRTYLLSRGGLIGFYHTSLQKAVSVYLLTTRIDRQQAHQKLAQYFAGQDDWLESLEEQQTRVKKHPSTPRLANARKTDELPRQWLEAGERDSLELLLTNTSFIEAKTEAGQLFDLLEDFSLALARSPEVPLEGLEAPVSKTCALLEHLEEALRRDANFIVRHPTTLFQCLWNSAWWYDSFEAARHQVSDTQHATELAEGRSAHHASDPVPEPHVSLWLEAWRRAKNVTFPGYTWLRSMRPPANSLGTALKAVLMGHPQAVSTMAVSPDGERLVSGSRDGSIRFWDPGTGAELRSFHRHTYSINDLAFSPDGRRLLIGSNDLTIRIWDVASGEELEVFKAEHSGARSVAWSPDGSWVAVSGGYSVWLRDSRSGAELGVLKSYYDPERQEYCGHFHDVLALALSPDGTRLASGSSDDEPIRIWDLASQRQVAECPGHRVVLCLAWSPDGSRIYSGSNDSTLREWDAITGTLLRQVSFPDVALAVRRLVISPDGRRLAGAVGRTVRVWNLLTLEETHRFEGHDDSVTSVAFLLDGRRLVSSGDIRDPNLRIWDLATTSQRRTFAGHRNPVGDVMFSPRGDWLLTTGDRHVHVWDPVTGLLLRSLGPFDDAVTAVAWSPDGLRVAIGSWDTTIQVWDLASQERLALLRGHQHTVHALSFSPDGRQLASASRDQTVRVWNLEKQDERHVLEGHTMHGPVTVVAYSPDGTLLAAGSAGSHYIYTYRLSDGQENQLEQPRGQACYALAFSHVGRLLASGTGLHEPSGSMQFGKLDQYPIYLFDLTQPDVPRQLDGHTESISSLAFTPDSQLLVSASQYAQNVRIWNRRGQLLEELPGMGDVAAIAAGADKPPFYALVKGIELTVYGAGGRPVASLPAAPSHLGTHPSQCLWAGAVSNYLYLLRLEQMGSKHPGSVRPELTTSDHK